MRKTAILALALAACARPAAALDEPIPSAYDPRVKSVTFNAGDVVQLNTVVGVATHIILEKGETYITHAFGDSDAYAFVIKKHHIFIKPKAERADTNLIVVTDRRSYKFRLTYRRTRADATYELAFVYPETTTQLNREAAARAEIERSFNKGVDAYNLAYAMSGDTAIAPVNVWDDGRFTSFKFAANTDLPAIYAVDADGNESIVNRTTVGEGNSIIVTHKVNPKWILRLGDQALAVFNKSYDAAGTSNTSRTASNAVQRVSVAVP